MGNAGQRRDRIRSALAVLSILSGYGVLVVLVLAFITMQAFGQSLAWYLRGVLNPRAGGQVFYPLAITAVVSFLGWRAFRKRRTLPNQHDGP